MFKHILVPLDGSRLAESALAMAASLARKFDASLTLIHVIEKDAPSEIHSERHLVSAGEASAYLDEVSNLSMLAGVRVSTHVHASQVIDVADSVTEHSAELAPDLIVMSRHGRGGARRLLFGTIAQQIISRGRTPVLVVRPSTDVRGESSSADWRIILAPIDGDPSHEKGLPVAIDMALAFHCRSALADGGADHRKARRIAGRLVPPPARDHAGEAGNGQRRRGRLPGGAGKGAAKRGRPRRAVRPHGGIPRAPSSRRRAA